MVIRSHASAEPDSPLQQAGRSFPVVELRQYTLHEGQRDVLIDLFEREFIESQEAFGMKIIGTFRDLDRPNRFVWLRGFTDMEERLSGLSQFYGGCKWEAHREQANATMIDSDNVLLLRAPGAGAQFQLNSPRPGIGERIHAGLVVATILYLDADPAEACRIFESEVAPRLERAGVSPLAWLLPESAPNNFPRLPVRQNEKLLVWFAAFSGTAEFEAQGAAIADATAPIRHLLTGEAEVLRLEPTARSELRGASPGALHDFDFLLGHWSVTHRRLSARGVGSADWQTYSGTAETRALLHGACNVEEHRIPGSASSGVALRCFDHSVGRWAIYWLSEREARIEPPVYGGFRGGEGLFEGDDEDRGRPVKVRFRWLRISSDRARWEQAFSYDRGRTWETNWIMEFERAPAS